MRSEAIDTLCKEWLAVHYSQEIADEYGEISLVAPDLNSPYLNAALDDFLGALASCFGNELTFLEVDYQEARQALGLPENRTTVPLVFIRAFRGG
ncbi:MAG: hypothetical protein ACOC7M_00475 [Chloroflexota bacterium]